MKVYRGAPGAARHYVEADRSRADDYYLTEGSGVAARFSVERDGRVVEHAGLSGNAYEAWVAGRDPDSGEPRGRVRDDARAVRFVEVVVNGPKSWSLAAELHPDVAAAYEAAQDQAARQILGWLGQHATTRVGPRGGQVAVPVERLEAAVVRHYTSRAGDPHRHLHLQVNARVFAAGRWRGLDTVAFRDSIAAVNGIGHAAISCDPDFRAALATHGYTLNREGEISQLAGFVGAFSKRAGQIAGLTERFEAEWRAQHPGAEPGPGLRRAWDARAWATDRPDKVIPRDGAQLRQRWLAELHELGYRDRDKPVQLALPLAGGIDRDIAAAEVIARVGAARSGWNAADVRGEVEQLLARTGLVADPAVRSELAEDLTARALALCVPLHEGGAVPEHVRALTSPHVLDVEADLVGRLAARGNQPDLTPAPLDAVRTDGLDAGQRAAVAALTGDAPLVLVEGAAGAGKTTTLAAVRTALQVQGRRLVVVTPTLKAAQAASAELATRAGSAAWLVWQHGYRWDESGSWTRTPTDPLPAAALRPGDLLLVDEAGLLDQDTARALVTIADEAGARLALVGDRAQLPAVGRGGVLDLAHRWTPPEARVDLATVHRFLRQAEDATLVPDEQYAALTLALRGGQEPAGVFDQLAARGLVVLHASEAERQTALAATIAGQRAAGQAPLVVVDTREHAAALSAAIREQLISAGAVDDTRGTSGSDGQRLGAGDVVVTRRNAPQLGVANRDTWTVARVHDDGRVTVSDPRRGPRDLPAGYVREHVQLGYAVTGYGAQGDTADTAHLVLSEGTTAASAYVGMTRGRRSNTVHLVAENLDDAREQWTSVAARERADLGPAAARAAAQRAAAGYAPARPLDRVLTDLHAAWSHQADLQHQLQQAITAREALEEIVALHRDRDRELAPVHARYQQACRAADQARAEVERSTAAIEQRVEAVRAELAQQWEAQRRDAYQAARTVQQGPGRLGLRLVAVNRATEQLARWSMTWQPYLPDMPTDTDRIARYATWPDHQQRLHEAFTSYARAQAAHAHPAHEGLQQAAHAADEQQHQARREVREVERRYDTQLGRYGRLGYLHDPEQRLTGVRAQLTDTRTRLTAAAHRLDQLAREPAVAGQPQSWLAEQHATWKRDRDEQRAAEERARRHAQQERSRLAIRPQPWQPTPSMDRGYGISR